MTWSAPMTAVANSTFSDVEYNKYVRDNMMEFFAAKATASGQYFVSATHTTGAVRTPASSTVAGSNTTTSTTYATLTGDQSVTVTSGAQILVWFAATLSNNTADSVTAMSVKVTGTSNVPAADRWRISIDGLPISQAQRLGSFHKFTMLKHGTYTVTLQGRVSAGTTGTFSNRHLAVFPM